MAKGFTAMLQVLENGICAGHGPIQAGGHHGLIGPLVGNALVIALAGMVTVVCFVLGFRMVFRPGERDRDHPKYRILGSDR